MSFFPRLLLELSARTCLLISGALFVLSGFCPRKNGMAGLEMGFADELTARVFLGPIIRSELFVIVLAFRDGIGR